MKLLFATLLIMPLVANAGTCESLSDLSGSIMKARQAGVSMQKAMAIANDGNKEALNNYTRLQVIKAYDSPRFTTDDYQMRAISDFSDEAYLECVKVVNK